MAGNNEPGAEYAPNPTLFNAFWKKLNQLTEVRPLTAEEKEKFEAEKRAAAWNKMSKNIKTLQEFISDLESVVEKIKEAGGAVGGLLKLIQRLKGYINILEAAVGMTDDAVQAAIEAQKDLSAWYRDAYSKCKTDGSRDPYGDQEYVCLAAIDRLYQGRNVKYVLGAQDGSFVRRVFNKWRDRLKDLVLPI